METLKKLFPLSFTGKDLKKLITALIIYVVADAVCGLIVGILKHLPVLGLLFGLVGTVLGVYFLIGFVLAILDYFDIIK